MDFMGFDGVHPGDFMVGEFQWEYHGNNRISSTIGGNELISDQSHG